MHKLLLIDTILNNIEYIYVVNNISIHYLIRSSNIGYYIIKLINKPYYYIIWYDNYFSTLPLNDVIKYYFPIINTNCSTISGIYLIVKYDNITNNVMDINNTLDDIRFECFGYKK